jgi:hypothetical protein
MMGAGSSGAGAAACCAIEGIAKTAIAQRFIANHRIVMLVLRDHSKLIA